MPPDDSRLNPNCTRLDQPCPVIACRGLFDPLACDHWRRLSAWRTLSEPDQVARTQVGIDPRVRDAVNTCPDRGSVLPISQQEDCGCRGRELSQCRAGRGTPSGKVTLRDCLDCQSDRLAGLELVGT